MAIYGVGAKYGGVDDKKDLFIQNGCACIGWAEDEAPGLHRMLRKVKTGDIIYIKSVGGRTSKELIIKAIGIVIDDTVTDRVGLGLGVSVKWVWQDEERIAISDEMYKNNVFNNTLYEEYNPEVQTLIINKMFPN